MEKVSISLFREGKTHRLVGLSIYEDEGDEEMRELIEIVEKSVKNHFSGVKINRQKAVRELCGERT